MHHNVDIQIDVHVGEDASTCAIDYAHPGLSTSSVDYAYPGSKVHVVGTAKRHPKDAPNPEIAEVLATARAFEALATRLLNRADALIERAGSKHQYLPMPGSYTIALANGEVWTSHG